jgi:predicted XRE-type DNA-binding protein
MSEERFASVWDAIEDTPAAAENLKLRSALMIALKEQIERQGWTQAEAARRFGVTQPRASDLMRGKIDLFGLDTLVNMAVAAGLHVEMRNCRRGVSEWADQACEPAARALRTASGEGAYRGGSRGHRQRMSGDHPFPGRGAADRD